jgi:hypothetical protein
MELKIDFTRHTEYADVRERGSVNILCIDRADGLRYFEAHYPAARGYRIETAENPCERCGRDVPRAELPRFKFTGGPGPLRAQAIVCRPCRAPEVSA